MSMARPVAKLIGEQLVQRSLISADQLRVAVDKQRLSGRQLGEVLVDEGILTETQVVEALSEQLGVPFVDVDSYEVDPAILTVFPTQFLREHVALPLFRVNNTVTVAMADPLDVRTVDRMRFLGHCEIEPVFATPTSVDKMLDRHFRTAGPLQDVIQQVKADATVGGRAAPPAGPEGGPQYHTPLGRG